VALALVEESLNLAYHGARAEKQGFKINMEKSFVSARIDLERSIRHAREIGQAAALNARSSSTERPSSLVRSRSSLSNRVFSIAITA
jgi:hypothetical protein